MVLAYDLLEDSCTIDVIIKEFLLLCFTMGVTFENLDNILRGWAKDEVQKSLIEILNKFEKHEEERKPFLWEKNSEELLDQFQSAAERE